jgi:hypothetical protein
MGYFGAVPYASPGNGVIVRFPQQRTGRKYPLSASDNVISGFMLMALEYPLWQRLLASAALFALIGVLVAFVPNLWKVGSSQDKTSEKSAPAVIDQSVKSYSQSGGITARSVNANEK